jgi:methylglyoxal synthase
LLVFMPITALDCTPVVVALARISPVSAVPLAAKRRK